MKKEGTSVMGVRMEFFILSSAGFFLNFRGHLHGHTGLYG
jgi:hypothetical protein